MGKYDIKFSHYGEERDINLNDDEKSFVAIIFDMLKDNVDVSKLRVTRKSDNYATIEVQKSDYFFDLIRFKYTERTKWISILLCNNDREKYSGDPLFEAQKKKTQFHWKSKMNSLNDLYKYKELLVNAYNALISEAMKNS